MIGLLALKLACLLPVCCVGPGLLIVSRLRWSPMEKLCGAFAASFIAIYLVSFAFFCLNAPVWAYWATSSLFAVMGLVGWRAARLLLANHQTRRVILAFAVVLAWDFLHLAMVRRYGGGNWAADWHEHYDRTRYFLHQLPYDYVFVRRYLLPARPPMMNVMAAYLCRQVGLSFEAYSLIFLFLNAWAFVPCCFLLGFFARRGMRYVPALAVLFMLNPSILENVTLTVTKALAAGLVVLGVCFYLRRRVVAAAVILAAGLLVHYSAAPFAAAVAVHYLVTFIPRRWPFWEAIVSGTAVAALLSTWFIWSILHFGAHSTFFSNTTATGTAAMSATDNLHRVLYNLYTSLIPHPFHSVDDLQYTHLGSWSQVNDYYFMMSQTTLPMMAGIAGGLIAVGLIVHAMFKQHGPAKRFFIFFLIFTYVVGIAVNPDRSAYGGAQVTLQSLALMAVTLVAASLPAIGPMVFRLLLLGTLLDYCLGILLQFHLESTVYQTAIGRGGQILIRADPVLGNSKAGEYHAKLMAGYLFWGDHLAGLMPFLEAASISLAVGAIWFLVRFHADQFVLARSEKA
jgi:hypothetical protein